MDSAASQVFLVRVPGEAVLEAIFSPRWGFRFATWPGSGYITGSGASRTHWLGTKIRQKCSLTSLAKQGQHLSSEVGQSCCVYVLSLGNSASGLLGTLVRFPGWIKLRYILSDGQDHEPTYLPELGSELPSQIGPQAELCT